MYIAEEHGKKIGAIRMDGSGKKVLVNVNLNPRAEGAWSRQQVNQAGYSVNFLKK